MKIILKFMLVLVLCLSLSSVAYASSSVHNNNTQKNGNNDQSSTIQPNDTGLNINAAFVQLSSTGTAIWYSGKFTSANTWISASCQTSLQWQSALGGSFQTEETQNKVTSENVKSMSTPTYIFTSPTWGYWRASNKVVAYWPSNIVPSNYSSTFACPKIYWHN